VSTISNIETMRNFEVMTGKFDTSRTCT